jgi:hypothetical protein
MVKGGKNMTRLLVIAVAGLFVIGCGSNPKEPADQKTDNDSAGAVTAEPDQTTCTSDTDCVPSSCCHAKTCVEKHSAPKRCDEMVCTAECVDGTMDCGKGSCGCRDGACVVNWSN